MFRDQVYLKLSHFAYERGLAEGYCGQTLSAIWATKTMHTGVDLSDMEEWQLLVIRDDQRTGFYGIAVQHMPTSAVIIAYRGSEWKLKDTGDIIADLSLITPFNHLIDCQQEQALALYDEMAAQAGVSSVHLTGHSLGGALAQKVSLGRQCKTVAFNAPGVLQIANLFEHFHNLRGIYEELIVNYVESGDIFVGNNPLFPHPGQVVRLDSFAGREQGEDCLMEDLVQFKFHGLSNFYNDLDEGGNIAGSRIEQNEERTSHLLTRLKNGLKELRHALRASGVLEKPIFLGGTGEIVLGEQPA